MDSANADLDLQSGTMGRNNHSSHTLMLSRKMHSWNDCANISLQALYWPVNQVPTIVCRCFTSKPRSKIPIKQIDDDGELQTSPAFRTRMESDSAGMSYHIANIREQ